MQDTIRRGQVVIGTIHYSNEASAIGSEVVVSTPFPLDGDSTEQCESYEQGLRFLHRAYEVHCEANGICPEPKPAEKPEVSAEDVYYASLAEREAAESADFEAHMRRQEAEYAAVAADESATLDSFLKAKEELERGSN